MRQPPDIFATLTMFVLCGVWGFQQVAMKLIAAEVDPLMQVAIRSSLAALLVLIASRLLMRTRWSGKGTLGPGILAGFLFGVEYVLISEGLRWTSAAHMSVFLYTAPVFAAIGLHIGLPAERLAPIQWFGIAVSFCGIALTFLLPAPGRMPAETANILLGDALGLLAGAAWGFTTVAVRTTSLSEAPVAQTLFYQLAGGAICCLAFAVLTDRLEMNLTALSIGIIAYHAIIVSFASYMVWFWLLRRYLASRLGILSFLTPLVGVALGSLILGETLETGFLIGAALVFSGILIVNGHDLFRHPQ